MRNTTIYREPTSALTCELQIVCVASYLAFFSNFFSFHPEPDDATSATSATLNKVLQTFLSLPVLAARGIWVLNVVWVVDILRLLFKMAILYLKN